MNIERYSIINDNSSLSYKFESNGPGGTIKKVVQFEKIKGLRENIYNLTMGDWDENKGTINDLVISNNNDTTKVLFTVAFTILEFVSHFPNTSVLIAGSTDSRTRLYQMAISKNVKEIDKLFYIQGFRNGYWENFQPGRNFEAFLMNKKPGKL
jgi:hypothetical protein